MSGVLLLYSVRFSEKWTKIIIIEIRSYNNKTNLIEEIFCSDNIMATSERTMYSALARDSTTVVATTRHRVQ